MTTIDEKLAVVTVVAGRHEHLRAQREFFARNAPDLHVVVAVDDLIAREVVAERPELPTVVVDLASTPAGLPIAAARNAGASTAMAHGATALVFLDVDCIASPQLLPTFRRTLEVHADAIVCGPVTYLPPRPEAGWTQEDLQAARHPHAARPDPAPGTTQALPAQLFWSLSFAVSAATWTRIGGFYEGYVGYGAEDTDFGRTAAELGTPILMAAGADAFHQHHPVSDPPVEHLDDIVRNSAVYLRRRGELPMQGWLHQFRERGLIRMVGGVPRRTDAVRVVTVPAQHAYLDAALPSTITRVDPDRVTGWEPDPLLSMAGLARWAPSIDVVHVHFGYEHLSRADLTDWVDAVRSAGIGLIVTVHDLRNPHDESPTRHDAHLRILLAAAQHVVTLTESAAQEIAQRYCCLPDVLPHPTLLDDIEVSSASERGYILMPLKSLRRNVRDPLNLVAAAADGARASGRRLRVLLEPAALEHPALRGVDALDVDLDVAGWLPHQEVAERVAAAHACVLPYRFGTHSGWIELARDLGTHIVAPDCGHHASQWDQVTVYVSNERDGFIAASLADTVASVGLRGPIAPADRSTRMVERDLVRAQHDVLYRGLRR